MDFNHVQVNQIKYHSCNMYKSELQKILQLMKAGN